MQLLPSPSPARILTLVLLSNLFAAAITTWIALSAPWLGLTLHSGDGEHILIAASAGPSKGIPAGVKLLTISGAMAGPAIALSANDLLEEPDEVDTYATMDAFFHRQERISKGLASTRTRIEWQRLDGSTASAVLTPGRRPLSSLPALFWFQLAIASTGCLIACWVWVLRPQDWGVRMFGITGLLFPAFVFPAAIYSSRELALPGTQFFALSAMNHLSAFMFGAAFIGIFLSYPRQLVAPRHLAWPPLIFGIWWLADVTRTAPDLDWGNRYAILTEMLLAIAAATVQWLRSRGSPLDRAALRWFILSLLLGSGLFIGSIIASVSLGWLPPLPQGYAFGFFLIIYAGVALGLRRHRLFELDEWAYRLLLWVGGATMVIGLDSILITGLHMSPTTSLGLALLASGWAYFPFRQWLWQRVAHPPRLQLHELMPDVVQIAFEPSRLEQETHWDRLLRRLYDPLEIRVETSPIFAHTMLAEQGLSLCVPGHGNLAQRVLRFPDRGGRFFSTRDVDFLDTLGKLLDQAETSRDAHERGIKEERKRIAQDIHDDVGARLLMLIHRASGTEMADIARAAMTDLRTALTALDARPRNLAHAMADWRIEIADRCEAARVALDWSENHDAATDVLLPSRTHVTMERTLREAVTNALKHARPSRIEVAVKNLPNRLQISVRDDGAAAPDQEWTEGRGLRNMRSRLHEVGGTVTINRLTGGGTCLDLELGLGPGA